MTGVLILPKNFIIKGSEVKIIFQKNGDLVLKFSKKLVEKFELLEFRVKGVKK